VRRFERLVRDYLTQHPTDILALSCWSSVSYRATLTTAKIFRELYPDRLIVVGGYHPSARPEEFRTPDNLIDYVVCGEGELALKEIAERSVVQGRPQETVIIKAPTFPHELFVPCDWDLVDSFAKGGPPIRVTNIFVYLSRGCPFRCSFCMESLKDHKWRALSAEQSIKEIRTVIERFHPQAIAVADACFGLRPLWRKEFLRALAAANPSCWLVFETRPEYLDEEDIALLSALKVEMQFGIESCSPRILRLMNKTRQPERYLAGFREVSALMSKHRVLHRANLIFNHPGETRETLQETFVFLDSMLTAEHSYLIWAGHGYMHFPGCEVDRRRSHYEREFGTRFRRPEWWREEFVRFEDTLDVQPSSDLSGGDTDLWERMMKDRDQKLRSVLAPPAFTFAAWKYFWEWRDDDRYRQV
jgi:anaerobic magnesium-protoporphyrin IX monomethyl ester cyclase